MSSIIKVHPMSSWLNGLMVDLPSPSSLSYMWNFGSLLGFTLGTQILTGLFLAVHYNPSMDLAFLSVEHIMRDVHQGWWMSYLHANGASLFLGCMYIHMARGMFYQSYAQPSALLWYMGMALFMVTMAVAFLGCILPWGQMSFWGATVMTNLLTTIPIIGQDLVQWMWGGPSVDQPTLSSFYTLHFLAPFLLMGLVAFHMLALHVHGSSNPTGTSANYDKMTLHHSYITKDVLGMLGIALLAVMLMAWYPNTLGHTDNYMESNPQVTPKHMQPEWYFLALYAMLSAVPSKLLGVLLMVSSIMMVVALPLTSLNLSSTFFPIQSWTFFNTFMALTMLGASPAEQPYTWLAQLGTTGYISIMVVTACSGLLSGAMMVRTNKANETGGSMSS